MTRARYAIDRTELTIALRHAAQGPWRLPANDQHGPDNSGPEVAA